MLYTIGIYLKKEAIQMDKNKINLIKKIYDLKDITEQINWLNELFYENKITPTEFTSINMQCIKQHHERLGVA